MATDRRRVTKAERLRLIRQLVAAGTDASVIRRRLRDGIRLPDGREVKVAAKTAERDVSEVADEVGAILEDDDLLRIEVGAAFSRIKKNGLEAARARKWRDAIYADRTILDFAARANPARFERATGRRADEGGLRGGGEADERLEELRAMTADELLAEGERARRIVEALGLGAPGEDVEGA